MMNTDEQLDRAFEFLEGPQKDIYQAISLFEQLARNGNMVAQFALGEIYWNGNDQIEQNNELLFTGILWQGKAAILWFSCGWETIIVLVSDQAQMLKKPSTGIPKQPLTMLY